MTLSAEAWLPLLLVAAPLRRPAGRTTFTPPAAPGGHLGAATLVLRSSVSGGSLARTPHVLLYLWASLPDGVRLAPQVQAQPQGRLSVWCCDTLPPAGHKAHLPRSLPSGVRRGAEAGLLLSVCRRWSLSCCVLAIVLFPIHTAGNPLLPDPVSHETVMITIPTWRTVSQCGVNLHFSQF